MLVEDPVAQVSTDSEVGEVPPGPVAAPDSSATVDTVQTLLDLALSADPFYSADLQPIARELLQQLAPQDAAEQMLVTQMIATFTRSMFLSRHANQQKNAKWFALYSGECDRAMNLYRKQMAALAGYRRPRRTVFNAIRTANIAGQQVVLNDIPTSAHACAEEPPHARPRPREKAKAPLPPLPPRPSRVAESDQENQALET